MYIAGWQILLVQLKIRPVQEKNKALNWFLRGSAWVWVSSCPFLCESTKNTSLAKIAKSIAYIESNWYVHIHCDGEIFVDRREKLYSQPRYDIYVNSIIRNVRLSLVKVQKKDSIFLPKYIIFMFITQLSVHESLLWPIWQSVSCINCFNNNNLRYVLVSWVMSETSFNKAR